MMYNYGVDINFKKAVVLSAAVHTAVIVSLCSFVVPKFEKVKRDQVVIDYMVAEQPKERAASLSIDTPKVTLAPKVAMAKPAAKPAQQAAPDKQSSEELAKKQAQIRSTEDYINYYQLIREKIRRNLKTRYRDSYGEGDVALVFVLNADGTLALSRVNEGITASGQSLRSVALSSLKDASPFSPFPKGLSVPQMPFTLTVTFKKRE